MRILRSKRAGISIVAAFLIAIFLISTITVSLMAVLQEQGHTAVYGVEAQQQVLESTREQLQATLEGAANGQLSVKAQNTGSVTAEVTQLLVTKSDNSLATLNINPAQILMPLEETTLTVAYTGTYLRLGLLTQRGNVFPVKTTPTPNPTPPPTPTPTPTPQPFDFALSVSPSSGTTQQTESVTATVTASLVSGSPQQISFSASGLPSGASATLNPTAGSPTFSSTLTITTSASTPAGPYTIIIHGLSNGLVRSASYTLTVASPSTATVYFYVSGVDSGGASGIPITVDGQSYTVGSFPLSFTWVIGSQHAYAWTSFETDESPYVSGLDTGYAWSYTATSNGLPTAVSGTITVPASGGSETAYYTRYVYVTTSASSGGSVSAGSGWYLPGAGFTATPNYGYSFSYWVVNGGTSTSNPIYLYNPTALYAVFSQITVPLTVTTKDYQGYAVSGASVYVYTSQETLYASGTTNSNGMITFQVPYGTYWLAVMQTTSAFGYTTSLYSWNDGSTNPVRSISVHGPTSYTATYKTPLTFQGLSAGIGTDLFTVGYWAKGTVASVHNTKINGVGVHITYNPNGSVTASASTTSGSSGSFSVNTYVGLTVTSLYEIDFSMTSAPNGYQPLSIYKFYP